MSLNDYLTERWTNKGSWLYMYYVHYKATHVLLHLYSYAGQLLRIHVKYYPLQSRLQWGIYN